MRREGSPLAPRFVKFKSKLRKTTNINLSAILYRYHVTGASSIHSSSLVSVTLRPALMMLPP